MTNHPFDAERDPALAALLHAQLTPVESASFTSRVLSRLGQRANPWDVLASWARPGIAAGLLLASLLGYWLVMGHRGVAPAASELLASDQQLDGGVVMDVVLGSRR